MDPVPLTFRRKGWAAIAQRLAIHGRLDLTTAIHADLSASVWEDPLQIWFDSGDAIEVLATAHQIALDHGRAGRSQAPTAVHETAPADQEEG